MQHSFQSIANEGDLQVQFNWAGAGTGAGAMALGFSDIKESTGSFSTSNVIGQRGFSTVYKGILPDGSLIAGKKFKDSATKADQGYCICHGMSDPPQHFMVYDFMANGSLADYLFKGNKPCLTWPQRYKIAVGIARGLAYLHHDAKPAIIHRDIKDANVVLDGDLNPPLADFGLARVCAIWASGRQSDVFSFGILLLELMSGRRVLDYHSGGDQRRLFHVHHKVHVACCELRGGQHATSCACVKSRLRLGNAGFSKGTKHVGAHMEEEMGTKSSIQEALAILEYIVNRPLSDIISFFNIALESAVENREKSIWLLSSNREETIKSNGGATLDEASMDSYNNGR
eukprot:Gb_24967 [translate_table: standard]